MKSFFARVLETYRPFWKPVLVVLGFLCLTRMFGLVTPYIFGRLIVLISQGAKLSTLQLLAFVGLAAYLIASVLNVRRDKHEIRRLDFDVRDYTTLMTLRKLFSLSIGQHRNENSGLIRSVIKEGEGSLTQLASILLYQLLPLATQTLVTLIALFVLDPLISGVVFVGCTVFIWSCVMANKKYHPRIKTHRDKGNSLSKRHSEILTNFSLIQTQSQEQRMTVEYAGGQDDCTSYGKGLWTDFMDSVLWRQVTTGLIQYAVLAIGILEIKLGWMDYGTLVTVVFWTGLLISNLGQIMPLHRQMLQLTSAVKKYFGIMDIEPAVPVAEHPIKPAAYAGRIVFKNVSFRYPETRYIEDEEGKQKSHKKNSTVLEAVSFEILPGQKVGLVGPSGAGKSTIVSLLLRAYDPDQGQVLVDGHDLRLLDLKAYREAVGLVEQNICLFDQTLRYNLTFGLNGRGGSVTDEELQRVAEESRIDGFFSRLPDGFETVIGENGIRLSGGERQRVGIGRALIKNPAMLIFDEATSQLDSVNEAAIREAIDRASKGRTTLVIAHRLSTVMHMDKIIVLNEGRVVGEGTHDELMESCATYQNLVSHQTISI